MLLKKEILMGSPELIRQITDSRKKRREEIGRKNLLKQGNPQEVAKAQAEADSICSKMRIVVLIDRHSGYISLRRDHGEIYVQEPFPFFRTGVENSAASKKLVRRANLQDARDWKEIVDALKEQRQ